MFLLQNFNWVVKTVYSDTFAEYFANCFFPPGCTSAEVILLMFCFSSCMRYFYFSFSFLSTYKLPECVDYNTGKGGGRMFPLTFPLLFSKKTLRLRKFCTNLWLVEFGLLTVNLTQVSSCYFKIIWHYFKMWWLTEPGGKENRYKLQGSKLQLDERRNFLAQRVVKYCSSFPQRLWNSHPWKYSKLAWVRPKEIW